MSAPALITPVSEIIDLTDEELGLLVQVIITAEFDAEIDATRYRQAGKADAADQMIEKAGWLHRLAVKFGGYHETG